MRQLAAAYHGPWDDIRETLDDPSRVNYTKFETHVLAAPWNRGRVVLIGDAAHACPPTLAQGGAQALEDAAVLAELLLASDSLDDGLWDSFHARRCAAGASRRRGLQPARTMVARPRAGRRPRPHAPDHHPREPAGMTRTLSAPGATP